MNRAYSYANIGWGRMPHSAKIKTAICTVAVLALCYVVFIQGGQNATAERGARAAEGIRMTSEQAEDMSETASAVGTIIEDAAVPPSSSSPSGMDVVAPTQDARPRITSDAWYVRRLESLVDRWGPKYGAAKADIEMFEHRFTTAQDRLREYFDQQTKLTGGVNDPMLKAELKRRDEEEREAYERWLMEGWQLLDRARAMGRELDDMDVVIRKQQLTVSMLSEYTTESSIPSSAESLYRSLGEFRVQSDQLARDLSIHVFN